MGKTRGQLKADIQSNLEDLSINYYSDDDINESMQDAYDDVAILTQCIQKNTTINWVSNLSYYDFASLGVTDYLGTTAIFNNVTNLWLRDDLNIKDFDRLRRDWEKWIGTPLFWAPSDPKRIAIAAKYKGDNTTAIVPGAFYSGGFSDGFYINYRISVPAALGSFNLYYWALAPKLTSDDDTYLIANDMQQVVSQYATADLLEQAQEYTKAQDWWKAYYDNIVSYADRVKRNTKSDLLLRV